jgi:hypothetical protein
MATEMRDFEERQADVVDVINDVEKLLEFLRCAGCCEKAEDFDNEIGEALAVVPAIRRALKELQS